MEKMAVVNREAGRAPSPGASPSRSIRRNAFVMRTAIGPAVEIGSLLLGHVRPSNPQGTRGTAQLPDRISNSSSRRRASVEERRHTKAMLDAHMCVRVGDIAEGGR